jgi:hypothetical protein
MMDWFVVPYAGTGMASAKNSGRKGSAGRRPLEVTTHEWPSHFTFS